MRFYSPNSPEAAARVVALVLLSDGHVCRSEYEALTQLGGVRDLGLEPRDLPGIVQALCEDLLMEGFDGRPLQRRVGDGPLAALLADVDDPELQSHVLRIAASVIHADSHLSDGEIVMLNAICRHWQSQLPTGVGKPEAAAHPLGQPGYRPGPVAALENALVF